MTASTKGILSWEFISAMRVVTTLNSSVICSVPPRLIRPFGMLFSSAGWDCRRASEPSVNWRYRFDEWLIGHFGTFVKTSRRLWKIHHRDVGRHSRLALAINA